MLLEEDVCLTQTDSEGRQMFFGGLIAKTEYHEQGMVCWEKTQNGAYEALKIAENVH